ncbi:UNVERIFIED_CONTAM: hypothetical protein FKN15_022795 [Acipenser sinensis]
MSGMIDEGGKRGKTVAEKRQLFMEMRAQNFDVIRLSTYRTACKLRFIQKRCNLHLVDVWNMIEAFRDNGLNTLDHNAEINVSRLETIISSIYFQLNKRLPTTHQINVEQSISLLLNFMIASYDSEGQGKLTVFSVKAMLSTMCGGKIVDKLRCDTMLFSAVEPQDYLVRHNVIDLMESNIKQYEMYIDSVTHIEKMKLSDGSIDSWATEAEVMAAVDLLNRPIHVYIDLKNKDCFKYEGTIEYIKNKNNPINLLYNNNHFSVIVFKDNETGRKSKYSGIIKKDHQNTSKTVKINQVKQRPPTDLGFNFDVNKQQRQLIAELENKNREILQEIQRLRLEHEQASQSTPEKAQQNPTLLAELRLLRQRKDELEQRMSALQESRRELMVQLEGLMKLLKDEEQKQAVSFSFECVTVDEAYCMLEIPKRLSCKCIRNREPSMKKASRPAVASSKTAAGSKTQSNEKLKSENGATGKSSSKTGGTAALSKTRSNDDLLAGVAGGLSVNNSVKGKRTCSVAGTSTAGTTGSSSEGKTKSSTGTSLGAGRVNGTDPCKAGSVPELAQAAGSPRSSPSHCASCPMPMPVRSTSDGSSPTHAPQDSLAGVGGDVQEAFAQGARKNLRNDLLVAADSITNTMSSLVKELHSDEGGEGEEEGKMQNGKDRD